MPGKASLTPAPLHGGEGFVLWRNARLATLAGDAAWGLIERGALLTDGERIRWVGAESDLPAGLGIDSEHDLAGAVDQDRPAVDEPPRGIAR